MVSGIVSVLLTGASPAFVENEAWDPRLNRCIPGWSALSWGRGPSEGGRGGGGISLGEVNCWPKGGSKVGWGVIGERHQTVCVIHIFARQGAVLFSFCSKNVIKCTQYCWRMAHLPVADCVYPALNLRSQG